MYFVVIGVLIILANLLGIGPMANWTWNLTGDLWKFCVPFVFAAIWWAWADKTGYYKRREIEKMDAKRQARREEQMVSLGTDRRANRKKQKATQR
jgi:small Trp-rich protein